MTFKEMRLAAGISQVELAQLCKTTQSAVSQWESGGVYPQASKLPILSKSLRASEKDIIKAIAQSKPAS